MNHEHDPRNPGRTGQDQYESEPPSSSSGGRITPAHPDPLDQGVQPYRQSDLPPDQPALPGLEPLNPHVVSFMHSGPTPHSSEIQRLNEINPGMGNRIMDDAHDDIVHDRQLSKESFDYVIWESRRRVKVATWLPFLSFIGIFACLGLFESPESVVGASLCGIGAVAPIVLGLLRKDQTPALKENPHTDDPETPGEPNKA